MTCPFCPDEGIQYCHLQVNLIEYQTNRWDVVGYRLCIGKDKCPLYHKLQGEEK